MTYDSGRNQSEQGHDIQKIKLVCSNE